MVLLPAQIISKNTEVNVTQRNSGVGQRQLLVSVRESFIPSVTLNSVNSSYM